MKTVNKKKRNRTPLILALVVLALVLFSGALSIRARQARTLNQYEDYPVEQGVIAQSVSGAGRVIATNREVVFAGAGGQIRNILVRLGDSVQADEIIIRTAGASEIRAPFAGSISAIYVKENEWINPGARLVEIIDYDSLEISAIVDELDIARIYEGQRARIDINALTNTEIYGEITRIAQEGILSGGITTFAVSVSVPQTAGLLIGMSAEIRVETARVEDVLVVPVQAIYYNENPYVLLRIDERNMREQTVLLGISDGRHVEIREGVTLGDTVTYRSARDDQRDLRPPFGRTR